MGDSEQQHFIPTTAGQKFAVETITEQEFNDLLRAVSRKSPSGVRNRGLFTLLYRSGLRLQEALDLHPRDLDLDKGSINVRSGKGSKQRIVGIDEAAGAMVQRWLDTRKRYDVTGKNPIFCLITKGRVGKALDPSYVRHALKKAAKLAGIQKRVHPHGLRHSLASDLLAEGVGLTTIQAQLGHSSAAITDRYLRRIAPHELVGAMRDRKWNPDNYSID